MVNILVIAVIFVVLLLIIAGFVTQQFNTTQQINENKRPKSLMEKMNKGLGMLDTDKFRQIVMDGGHDEMSEQVESLIDEEDRTSASSLAGGAADQTPDDLVVASDIMEAGGGLNIEGKDLQTIYAEYLSEKNLNPFELEPDFKLGVAYLKFSQFEKAQKQFQKIIDEKPDYPGVHYYVGEAFRCNGQFYEAMKAYKQSWEMESKEQKQAEEEEINPISESILKNLE